MEIQKLYQTFLSCTGVSIDTRTLSKGNLFIAIKGDNFDGNKYAQKAIDAGAKFALVDDLSLAKDNQFIYADNCLDTLQKLANYHRKRFTGDVLGITGSNGKTTTKELIFRVLKTHLNVQCTKGNLNNHLGVPLTLLDMDIDLDVAIIEMGANHVGEIASLCQIAEPTQGLITNIGTAHIGEFGGRENIIRAKSELFDYLLKNDGQVFINTSDEVLDNMSKRFSSPIKYPNNLSSFIECKPFVNYLDNNNELYKTQLMGSYNFLNISAAITIGDYFKIQLDKVHDAIVTYTSDNNRSQLVTMVSNSIILDAYNANPDSVKVALDHLSEFNVDRKIAILGDMKELGSYSRNEHEKIIQHAQKLNLESCYFVGEEYSQIDTNNFSKVDELKEYLIKNPISDAVVLLKESRSMAMEQLIDEKEIWN